MRPRVLVLDDEADIRRLLRDTPTDEGMEVTEAADGLEALQSPAEALEPFDVNPARPNPMPRMDGRTFYTLMRTGGYESPVMILSSCGAEEARRELRSEAALRAALRPPGSAARWTCSSWASSSRSPARCWTCGPWGCC